MTDDVLDQVEDHLSILISAELETQHLFGSHPEPVEECPRCRASGRVAS